MKLAIVAQPFDRVPGGGSVAIWIHELSHQLAKQHDITVFSRAHEAQARHERTDGIDHVRVRTPIDDITVRILQALSRRVGHEDALFHRYYFGASYYRGYSRQISKRIADGSFDAVLVNNFAQFVPTTRRRNPAARIVLMMHCDWLVELDPHRTRQWIASADAICGCSDHVARGVAKRFPEYADRCHPILNGSNPDRFAERSATRERAKALRSELGLEKKTVVLFVGRVCPEKGVHVLVDAMKIVQQRRDDVVLLLAGSHSQQPPSPLWLEHRDERFADFESLKPNYRSHLESLARSLGDRVRFLGKLPYEDLPDYYGLADIFVHPAIWQEPFGMTLTEAMGCGLPVISTRAGGIPEIVVDGETGLLARPGDPETLADAIITLASDPVARREMGRRGLERLRETFTWEHTAQRMDSVLADRRGAQSLSPVSGD